MLYTFKLRDNIGEGYITIWDDVVVKTLCCHSPGASRGSIFKRKEVRLKRDAIPPTTDSVGRGFFASISMNRIEEIKLQIKNGYFNRLKNIDDHIVFLREQIKHESEEIKWAKEMIHITKEDNEFYKQYLRRAKASRLRNKKSLQKWTKERAELAILIKTEYPEH